MGMESKEKKLPKGISLRKDGRYMGRVTFEGETVTVYGSTVSETRKKLDEKRYELQHGLFCKETDMTVKAWFEVWIKEYKSLTIKQGTVKLYTCYFYTYIDKAVGKKKLKDIRAEHIQKIYNDMHRMQYSHKTIELVSGVLSGMFKQALKNEMINKNPVPLATLPKGGEKKERRVLTKEEQSTFLAYAKQSQYARIFEFALSTGMRGGEIKGLLWENVDFQKKLIYVKVTLNKDGIGFYLGSPKTSSSVRTIPMMDNVYALLKKQKTWQAEMRLKLGEEWKPCDGLNNLVFTTNVGSPIDKEYLKNSMDGIVKRINADGIEFEHITMHTFRHSFATRCIESGMNPQTLKAILGHSKLSMTMDLYAHVLPDTKAEEMQKIANLF